MAEQLGIMESVLMQGDLSKLTSLQRVEYYGQVCKSLGLNPLTRPFDFITLNGKMVLYAKRDATDQLRAINRVSVKIASREVTNEIYVVMATATSQDGRTDESIGAVSIKGLQGDALANGMMKAETKAKRRVTLSIVGLGWLDETEVDSVPSAKSVIVDAATGEIAAPDVKQVEAPKASANAQAWISDKAKVAELNSQIANLGLTGKEALEAMEVHKLSEFSKSFEAAVAMFDKYIAARVTEIETEPEEGQLQS